MNRRKYSLADRVLCPDCNQYKNPEDFSLNSARPNGRARECRACHSDTNRQHYENNRGYYHDKSASLRALGLERKRQLILANLPTYCARCPTLLDVSNYRRVVRAGDAPSPKSFNQMAAHGWSEERILFEMRRVELCCPACARAAAEEPAALY